jgi:hypothetical protein
VTKAPSRQNNNNKTRNKKRFCSLATRLIEQTNKETRQIKEGYILCVEGDASTNKPARVCATMPNDNYKMLAQGRTARYGRFTLATACEGGFASCRLVHAT